MIFFPFHAWLNYICLYYYNLWSLCSVQYIIFQQKTVAPVLKTLRNPPDTVADYKAEYGYLGPQLQVAVVKARQAPPPTATTLTAPIRAITPTTTRIIQPGQNLLLKVVKGLKALLFQLLSSPWKCTSFMFSKYF